MENMSSLVREIIENLNCEIMIDKLIFNNFKFNYLDNINNSNYENVLLNSKKINSALNSFMNSKTFKEETNILTSYFFGKKENIKNNIFNYSKFSFSLINEDENNINNLKNLSNVSSIRKSNDNNPLYNPSFL